MRTAPRAMAPGKTSVCFVHATCPSWVGGLCSPSSFSAELVSRAPLKCLGDRGSREQKGVTAAPRARSGTCHVITCHWPSLVTRPHLTSGRQSRTKGMTEGGTGPCTHRGARPGPDSAREYNGDRRRSFVYEGHFWRSIFHCSHRPCPEPCSYPSAASDVPRDPDQRHKDGENKQDFSAVDVRPCSQAG